MEKKIDKKKIVTYAAAGLLAATVTTARGIQIYESSIDHTTEICQICQIVDIPLNEQEGLTVGIKHQMDEMQEEYLVQGLDANVTFDNDYEYISENKIYIKATTKTLEDGTIINTVPSGYVLEDGKGVKTINEKINVGPTIVTDLSKESKDKKIQILGALQDDNLNFALITPTSDNSNKITYVAPVGYHIEEFGGLPYSVPDGYRLEYIEGVLTEVKVPKSKVLVQKNGR